MISLRMTDKIRDKQGRIIGCIAVDKDNKKYSIPKSDFLKYNFVNVKITQDLKIKSISKKSSIVQPTSGIDSSGEVITLYHGSHKGLSGDIRSNESRTTCDFGLGFYTGDRIEQAKTIIADDDTGVLYTLNIRLDNLRVYKFTNSIEWALYVGVHRGKINRSSYKKLDNFITYIDSYDIVVGPIADDHMRETYTDFLDGVITDTVLVKCLSEIQLGNQYVFKNNRACKDIRIMRTETLSKDERKRLRHAWRVKIGTMDKSLGIIKSDYRRKGLFVDELLKSWR